MNIELRGKGKESRTARERLIALSDRVDSICGTLQWVSCEIMEIFEQLDDEQRELQNFLSPKKPFDQEDKNIAILK